MKTKGKIAALIWVVVAALIVAALMKVYPALQVYKMVAGQLSKATEMRADCDKQGELNYSIESFSDVPVETLPGYRDCVENVVEFSTTQGVDLKVTDPAVLCKCINVNIRGMRKKYSSTTDQCLMFRAIESIQRQCHLMAAKK